jgi:hypothetical protein
MESFMLGVDRGTHKLQYTMHINLGKLQQSIDQSVDKNPDGVGPRGVAHGVTGKVKNVRREKVNLHVPSSSKKGHVQDTGSRAETRQDELLVPAEDQDIPHKVETGEDMEGVTPSERAMSLTGLTLSVMSHEDIPPLTTSKRENVRMIKEAEKEMCTSRRQLKHSPSKKPSSKLDAMTKDEFSFTRVYGTMNLGLLNKMDKVHHIRRASEEQEEKAKLVARVRRDRVMCRGKVEAFQQHLKDKVRVWKCREEGKLEQRREVLDKERGAELAELSHHREVERRSAHKQQEDREMSNSFRQNSALIGNTLSAEDRKASADQNTVAVQDKVRQMKQDSLEQQEEARKYLEHRRNRMWEEGRQEKQNIDAKMLEVSERVCSSLSDTPVSHNNIVPLLEAPASVGQLDRNLR